MNKKRIIMLNLIIAAIVLAVNSIYIVSRSEMLVGGNVIRNCFICFYYMIFYCFDKWLNAGITMVLLSALFGGMKIKNKFSSWSLLCGLSGGLVLYVSIFLWMAGAGELLEGKIEYLLQGEYYVLSVCWMFLLGNYIRNQVTGINNSQCENLKGIRYDNIRKVLLIIFVIGLIPVFMASPYIFPQADDWSYSANAHQAFISTHSIWQVIMGAARKVKTTYFRNQGTFSSIFMMGLQPGVFGEELYAVVPFLFVGVICLSGVFFFKTLFRDYLKVENNYWITVLMLYLIVAIQCIPSKVTAFFWYNGAVHYIMAQAVLLCMFSFMLRIYMGKRLWSNCLGAVLTSIYVGGGNLISGVEALAAVGTIILVLILTKTWKRYWAILAACFTYIISFGINVIAPGNYNRAELGEIEMDLVQGVVLAFTDSISYTLGEWLHWTIILFALLCIPVLWKIAGKIKYDFRYPAVVLGYSWCYMAGVFFAPAYVMDGLQLGRYQNIMFLVYLIWIIIDLTYILGWIQRKYNIKRLIKNEKNYYIAVCAVGVIMLLPSVIAESKFYTFSFAAETLLSGEAQEYAKVYRENIEILRNSTEDEVTVYELTIQPELFSSSEMEPWYNGMRLFYNKSRINYVPWNGE